MLLCYTLYIVNMFTKESLSWHRLQGYNNTHYVTQPSLTVNNEPIKISAFTRIKGL